MRIRKKVPKVTKRDRIVKAKHNASILKKKIKSAPKKGKVVESQSPKTGETTYSLNKDSTKEAKKMAIKRVNTKLKAQKKGIRKSHSVAKAKAKTSTLASRGIKTAPKAQKASIKSSTKRSKALAKSTHKLRKAGAGSGFCSTGAGGSPSCNSTSKAAKKSAMSKRKVKTKVRYRR